MICGSLICSRDQPGALQVWGLKEAKPLEPPRGTLQERSAHFKLKSTKPDFLGVGNAELHNLEAKSWHKRTVLMLGVEGGA